MENFNSFGLPNTMLDTLNHIKYHTPTPIQAQSIPHALKGADILGSAQTGTGKTAAYTIPLITKLISDESTQALIIAPTRELALQINDTCKLLAGKLPKLKSVLLIGGDSIKDQIFSLKKAKPNIIVGTPGRLVDLLNRKVLNLSKINYLVLDETDRMLDMGFSIDLDKIINCLPKSRQTLMFSATISSYIENIAQKYLTNPIRISTGATNLPNQHITENLVKVNNEDDKYQTLLAQLNNSDGLKIIFVKTKISTSDLAVNLTKDGFKATAIHGDLRQHQRLRAIKNFKTAKYKILVATDVVGRGLDIPNIAYVINYDLPQCPEDYIHRIGRTGRAGVSGQAINLISPKDYIKWREICKLTGKQNELAGKGSERRKDKRNSSPKDKDSFSRRKNFDPKQRKFKSKYKF